jgi:hypothetical protein
LLLLLHSLGCSRQAQQRQGEQRLPVLLVLAWLRVGPLEDIV